jgi:hypothetical protein
VPLPIVARLKGAFMNEPSLQEIQNQLNAIQDAVNWGDQQNAEILKRLPPLPHAHFVCGVIINRSTGVFVSMSQTNTIALTNCANPALATFFHGLIDLDGGTALPALAVTAGNPALVAIVPAAAAGPTATQFLFDVYPIGTSDEANDAVTVTATLPDGAALLFNFLISGNGETMTEDSTSGVQSWANAPAVPTAPV